MLIQQSASGIVRTFLLTAVGSLNGYAGGASVQVRLSKNGGAFAAAGAGLPVLLESGIYKYVYTTTEVDTLGILTVSARASGAVPTDFTDEVVGFNPQRAWELREDIQNRFNEYGAVRPTVSGRTLAIAAAGQAGIDWANIGGPTTVVALSGTTISGVASQAPPGPTTADIWSYAVGRHVNTVIGAVGSVAGAVGSVTGNVGGNVVGSVGSIASSGILISSLHPDATLEIAGRVLRRGLAHVENDLDDRSLGWAIAKLVNKMSRSTTTLTMTKTDDATTLFTQAITTSGGALPIVAADTT